MEAIEIRTPIYHTQPSVQRQLTVLADSNLEQRNKDNLHAFAQYLLAKGTGKSRLAKMLCLLRRLCSMVNKPLITLEKRDVEALVAAINQTETWKEHTKSDYRRAIKQFFRWYEDEDPRLRSSAEVREQTKRLYTYVSRNIKCKVKQKTIDYGNIITDEDAQKLITKGCSTTMERAMVAFLHESGCRVGELLGLRLKDIERKDRHYMIALDGKTGPRRIPIIQSVPYIEQWIQDHPFKDNKNALLWVSTHSGRHYHKQIRYYGVVKILESCAEKAGYCKTSQKQYHSKNGTECQYKIRHDFTKQINPHWFRHSRATILAPKYSEAVLCQLMGWVPGSNQVRTYVHMGAGQVEDKFLQINGIKREEQVTTTHQFCVCGSINTGVASYCYRCGNALNTGVIVQEQAATTEALGQLSRIMGDPALLQRFQELLKNTEK